MLHKVTHPNSLVRIYAFSALATVATFIAVAYYGGPAALLTVLVLSALEITFSFDNAVVNAKVLEKMPPFWQKAFLTVGIFIAVFGMRLVLPVVLVAVTANLGVGDVVPLHRRAAEGGLQPGETAVRSRVADRAEPVGADRPGDEAAGDRGRRAAGDPPGQRSVSQGLWAGP